MPVRWQIEAQKCQSRNVSGSGSLARVPGTRTATGTYMANMSCSLYATTPTQSGAHLCTN